MSSVKTGDSIIRGMFAFLTFSSLQDFNARKKEGAALYRYDMIEYILYIHGGKCRHLSLSYIMVFL